MQLNFDTAAREVLEQVVQEPRFRALTQIPLVAPMEFGLVVFAYALFGLSTWAYLNNTMPLLVMWVLSGFAIYASFTPLHDATHRTVSCHRGLNDLLGTLACGLLIPGITTGVYRYLHLEHHRFAGDPKRDPDEPFVSATSWRAVAVTAGLDVLWTAWYLRHWHSRPRAERFEFSMSITVYLGLHLAALSSPWALEFFLCWMIPQRIGLFLVAWFFARIQHPQDVLWEHAPFQTTVRIVCSHLSDLLMLGQTRHCLHHFAPSVPYYRYHRAWDLGRALFETQNIPTRSLWSTSDNLQLPAVSPATWLSARVERVRRVADDVQAYELVPADDAGWPKFTPGAHIDVEIADGLVRQYSLCNPPGERNRYLIAVRHDPNGRGGSSRLHAELRPGDVLRIGTPRNNFRLSEEFGDYLLLAGGIGVTPLLAMAHHLHQLGRQFELHQCARSRDSLVFADELADWPFADQVYAWLDDQAADKRFNALEQIGAYRPGRAIYVCGPQGFMQMVLASARECGFPESALFSETFVPARMDAQANREFEVEIASTGQVLRVEPDEFLLDVLQANGYYVMCSCTQGICGSCITPVLAGEPEHRDAILSEVERNQNKKMTVCVSRAKSARIVLDL